VKSIEFEVDIKELTMNKFDAMSDEGVKRYFLEHRDDESFHAYMDRCYARPNENHPRRS